MLEIEVPPLRDRPEDISRLAVFFLDRLLEEDPRHKTRALSEEALHRLVEYPWPGNVRELQNVIQRALARARSTLISAEDIDACLEHPHSPPSSAIAALPREKALVGFERDYLISALERHGGNVSQTARALGIHRTTLQRLMKKYDLRSQRR